MLITDMKCPDCGHTVSKLAFNKIKNGKPWLVCLCKKRKVIEFEPIKTREGLSK